MRMLNVRGTFVHQLSTLLVVQQQVMSIRGALVCIFFATVALAGGARGQIHVGDLLAPGQKWYNYDTTAQIVIDKINTKNATFAGVYQITKEGPTSTFPFRGEFDPAGVTIGWVVSYWNDNVNYHSLGAWTGYAKVAPESQRPYLSMSRSIAHQDSYNTTSGYGTFSLWSN